MITVNDIKNYLNVTSTENDSLLSTYIDYATSQIENWCHAPILATDIEFLFNSVNSEYKYLPFVNVNSLGTVSERDAPNESWSLVTCYLTNKSNVYYLYNENTFDAVEYKAELNVGFSTIPDDLKLICTEITATIWNESNKADDGTGRLGIGTHNTQGLNGLQQNTTFLDLTQKWQNRLRKYTVPTV